MSQKTERKKCVGTVNKVNSHKKRDMFNFLKLRVLPYPALWEKVPAKFNVYGIYFIIQEYINHVTIINDNNFIFSNLISTAFKSLQQT